MKGKADLVVLKLRRHSQVSYLVPDRELCMAVGELCRAAGQGGLIRTVFFWRGEGERLGSS